MNFLLPIVSHGKRADAIVKGMRQHSRSSNGQKQPTDINTLADEYLRLAYHRLCAKNKSCNARIKTDLDPGIGKINVAPKDIGRVTLNVISNPFYEVSQRKLIGSQNGEHLGPTVTLRSKKINARLDDPVGRDRLWYLLLTMVLAYQRTSLIKYFCLFLKQN